MQKKSAYEYFAGDLKAMDRFVRTIVDDVFRNAHDEWEVKNRKFVKDNPKLWEEIGKKLFYEPMERLKTALMNPVDEEFDNMRFCDDCGKPFEEGYCLDAEEYYCSEECLHKHYTRGQWLAMYAGLDNTDPQEVKKALKMTQEELDEASEENDSQCYWSSWEWIA